MKSIVYSDFDNVIYDWINPFLKWFNNKYNTHYVENDVKEYDLKKIDKRMNRIILEEFNYYATCEKQNTKKIDRLINQYNFVIITNRIKAEYNQSFISCALNNCVSIIFTGGLQKAKYLPSNCIFIDDNPYEIEQCKDETITKLLFKKNWNNGNISNWDDIEKIIKEKVGK